MAGNILLATYVVEITNILENKRLLLSRFPNGKDFYDLFQDFVVELGKKPYHDRIIEDDAYKKKEANKNKEKRRRS